MAETGIHFNEASAPQGMRLYAIGDIHGRLDLLEAMHRHIAAELAADRPADWRIVHLGDYVDRGPASKGVLDFLMAAHAREPRHLMLTGNHDVGFLDFIERPDPYGLFMTNGGVETARSYGVNLQRKGFLRSAGRSLHEGHAALVSAVPSTHLDLLRSLPHSLQFGDFFFCHAGIRPGIPFADQLDFDLMWIRGEFHAHTGLYPKVVVHGHTPVAEADVKANRVNLDTGAYYTGRLSALAVEGVSKRILVATEAGVAQRSVAVTP
ncbi:metallophosphatase [Mesorhizobium sp. Root157]|uniref:metallophosphoesterase n=1 Tax=Mesorhizobium sp. Root157 TaxID=1736477 RepID=UPI00070127F0|nr:metallophosphoesterase [Mesorhizobium sp. Root157]KQZ93219.1 metallophosphatase [Mesorhizobium sp. Root157]